MPADLNALAGDDELAGLLTSFLEGRSSPALREAYAQDLRWLAAWLRSERKSVREMGRRDAERYAAWLHGSGCPAPARKLGAAMELHEHLALAGATLRLPRSAFAPHVRPRALGAPALPAAAGPGGGDGALLALLAAGLRSGEVCALDVEDVSGDGATLTVSGRGGVRELPLDGRLSELLAVVVAGRSSGPLFTGPGRGGRLDERAVRRRVSAAAPDRGVHELRAWAVRSAAAQRGAGSGS